MPEPVYSAAEVDALLATVDDRLAVLESGVVPPPVVEPPPAGTGETLDDALRGFYGPPYTGVGWQGDNGTGSQRAGQDRALLGINRDYSWYHGVTLDDSYRAEHKLNVWFEMIQGEGTSPAWSAQDGVQVTQYMTVCFDGSKWVTIVQTNETEDGQYIDGGVDGTWTAHFSFLPSNMRRATAQEGTGWVVRYDHLQQGHINAVHGWDRPNRVVQPATTQVAHSSAWMRLVGPNAQRNANLFVGCVTSDRYWQDNQPDNYNAIGHPRFNFLTDQWKCFGMTGMTERIPMPGRQDADYMAAWLRGHADFPKNPRPA